jgi:YD repeat-containing protein
MGGFTTTIDYGAKVTVTDADKSVKEYTLERIGDYSVIQSVAVKDEKEGTFTTTFRHNADTQVTRMVNPLGNGVAYSYAPTNSPVTLGPIRDWVGKYTYENDLARGNLVGVTIFGRDGKDDGKDVLTSKESFERLYNQPEFSTDAAGNLTKRTYLYENQGDRGNPKTVQGPPVEQPVGAPIPASTTTYTYNDFGQVVAEDRAGGRVTSFKYNPRHYLERADFPGGGFETYTPSERGQIMTQVGSGGTITYARNGRGLVTSKTVGPANLNIRTSYEYDLNNNETKITLRVEDAFGDSAAKYGLFEQIGKDRVVRSAYDILDRRISETKEADNKKLITSYKYGPGDHIVEVHAPPLAATGELFTKYSFNARGLVTEKVEAFGTPAAFTTKNIYNENGNLVREETSGNKLTSWREFVYDDLERHVGTSTALGTDTVHQYDKLGNLIHGEISGYQGKGPVKVLLSQTDYKYDAYKHKISERRDTLNNAVLETQWFYDGDLELRKQKNPNGGEATFDYDLAGHLTDTTDPLGNKTHNVYDAAGNLKQVEEATTEQVFDNGAGKFNPKETKYATTNTYDAVGRLTDSVSPADTVHMFYDSAGQVRGIASTAQGTMLYRYDGFGRRTDVTRNGFNTRTQYTPGGLAMDVQSPTSHDTYVYDALGHTIRRTDALIGKMSETTFLYDGLGRQYRVIDPNSTTIDRTFNDAGLPLTITIDLPPAIRANGKSYTAVDGMRSETYTYDGLGRVLTAETNEGSKVALKYDGLGRVLEETQSFLGVSQTVKHVYSPDDRYSDMIYPAIAGGGRVRNTYDALGRTTEVALDNSPIANYLYTGTDRFAQRQTPNGVRTRYQYDARRRLTRMDASQPGGGTPAGQALWSQTATYIEGLPKTIQEVVQATETAPARVLTSTLTYDADGRVTTSSTKQAVSIPRAGATVEDSTSFSRFENGRLKEMAEYARDDLSGLIQTARIDVFNYAPDGRIDTLASSGLLKAKSDTAPGDIEDVTRKIDDAGSDKIAVTQKFTYDYKGNLIHDGRFGYTYDYMDRLIRVADDWAPFRYNETIYFSYDALGRRIRATPRRDRVPQGLVRWGGAWEKVPQVFIYDGDALIAEVLPEPAAPATGQVLLARYFFGAKPNERLRMDRRPENEPMGRLETFYLNEDLQGNYRMLTNSSGDPVFIQNREPAPGTEDAAPERPPGDEMYIIGSNVRVPYFNSATRIDGFAGTVYSETAKAAIFNYRSAYVFSSKVDRAFLKASIAQQQNRLLAVFGTMAAAPVVAPVAATGAATVGAVGLAKAATIGGLVNVGLGYGQARVFHTEYGAGDALKEFGTGAIMGVTGGMLEGLQLGFWATRALDFGSSVAGGAVWDVGVNDMGWGAAVQNNLASAAVGTVIGTAIGHLQHSKSAAKATALAEKLEAAAVSIEHVPAARASRPDTVARSMAKTKALATGSGKMRDRYLGDARTAEEKLFDAMIMNELRFGGAYPAEILRRIESGELKVLLREFNEWDDILYSKGYQDSAGFYEAHDRSVLHLNTRQIDKVNGRWSARMTAGVVVHEGCSLFGIGRIIRPCRRSTVLYQAIRELYLEAQSGRSGDE